MWESHGKEQNITDIDVLDKGITAALKGFATTLLR